MGRTYKDSTQGTTLTFQRSTDGTFKLFINRKLDSTNLDERSLEEACCRFGYCQQEAEEILQELMKTREAIRRY